MEVLSGRQLGELGKRAKEAAKGGRLSFFEHQVKENFPWLTPDVVQRQLVSERQTKWDTGLLFGGLSVYIAGGIFLVRQAELTHQFNPADGTLFLAALLYIGAVAFRLPSRDEIRDAYSSFIEEHEVEAERLEISRLDQLINGEPEFTSH